MRRVVARCIYCREVSTTRFPKEHVIPRACGRELDVVLTRDSIEALLRVRHGVKAKNEARQIGRSRLSCKVVSLGEYRGARVTSARDSSKPELRGNPVPQVAFRKFGEDEWHWFLGNELDQVEGWERFRADAETLIVGPPGDDVSRL